MRKSTIFLLGFAGICAVMLYYTSQKVHDEREKLVVIEAQIGKEQESMRVLSAEWSYLNQPDRLEKLAREHLHLEPLKGRQFAKLKDIPLPPPRETEKPVEETMVTGAADPSVAKTTVLKEIVSQTIIPKISLSENAPQKPILQNLEPQKPAPQKAIPEKSAALQPAVPVSPKPPVIKRSFVAVSPLPSVASPAAAKKTVISNTASPPHRDFNDLMKSLGTP